MSMHRETKELSMYVLRPIDGVPHKFRPPDGNRNPERRGPKLQIATPEGAIETDSIGVNMLTTWLQNTLKSPVINESGVPSVFPASFHFSLKNGGEPALRKAVKDQLGLDLAQNRRSLEFLMIDRAEKLPSTRDAR